MKNSTTRMLNDLKSLIRHPKFTEANSKVSNWRNRLANATADDARQILREKGGYFASLQKSHPEIYGSFHLSNLELSERITKIIHGKEVIID